MVCERCGTGKVTTDTGELCDGCLAAIWESCGQIGAEVLARNGPPKPLADLHGKTFGRWKVLKRSVRRPNTTNTYWSCRCGCGAVQDVAATNLTRPNGSRGCRKCDLAERVAKPCATCGKTYTGTKRSRYCSKECRPKPAKK
jgi:hypothetical protein